MSETHNPKQVSRRMVDTSKVCDYSLYDHLDNLHQNVFVSTLAKATPGHL
jgi:hypothetical protein